jgi:membrane protein EpsK
LGVAGYAIIPLATSLTNYVGLVVQSLNSSVSRYLTIDIQRSDYEKANETFNTALFGTLIIVILMLPIVLFVSYYAPDFFSISPDQKQDSIILFVGVICAFLIKAWSSNFNVVLFAHNRLDLQNITNGIELITRIFLIIVFFTMNSPKLSYIGISYFLGTLVALMITVYFSKKINPNLAMNPKYFRKDQVKSITQTGGWMTINQIGSLFFLQIDLIVVNRLFGSVAGGEYALVIVWSSLIRRIAGLLAGVLTPVILSYYSNKRIQDIITVSQISVNILGISMALPIGLICGFSPALLSLWVGPEFSKLWPLMMFHLLPLVINLSVLPLFSINVAYNKVKIPGLVTFFAGIGNLVLAVALPLLTNLGYYGVALAGAIMLTTKNAIFTPLYSAKIMSIPSKSFIASMIPGFLLVFITTLISWTFYYFLQISTIMHMVIFCFLFSGVYVTCVWILILTEIEKRMILSFAPSSIKKRLGQWHNYL